MNSVMVPKDVLSEAAGLLDCEGYGPIAMVLNNLIAAAPPPAEAPALTVEGVEAVLREKIHRTSRLYSVRTGERRYGVGGYREAAQAIVRMAEKGGVG